MTAKLDIPQQFKNRAEAAMPGRIRKLVLFGSRARGDAVAGSDWDLAVFLDREPDTGDRDALSDAAFDVMIQNDGAPIQTVALPLSALEDDTLLIRNIRRDGVPF